MRRADPELFTVCRHFNRTLQIGSIDGDRAQAIQYGAGWLRAARLRLSGVHGDYELGPLTETSERMIVLAGRGGARR